MTGTVGLLPQCPVRVSSRVCVCVCVCVCVRAGWLRLVCLPASSVVSSWPGPCLLPDAVLRFALLQHCLACLFSPRGPLPIHCSGSRHSVQPTPGHRYGAHLPTCGFGPRQRCHNQMRGARAALSCQTGWTVAQTRKRQINISFLVRLLLRRPRECPNSVCPGTIPVTTGGTKGLCVKSYVPLSIANGS